MPDVWEVWLDPAVEAAALESLLVPFPANRMDAFAVSDGVNSVKINGVAYIAPIQAT
jgi:putative SOS response-associated peptidase YedK